LKTLEESDNHRRPPIDAPTSSPGTSEEYQHRDGKSAKLAGPECLSNDPSDHSLARLDTPTTGAEDSSDPQTTSRGLMGKPLTSNDYKNFRCYSLYQIFLRTGWIFKTESIIMPAVLDLIGGSGWLRGCLPMLNRLGQSIPPLLVSDFVRNARRKKFGLSVSTAIMGVCFLTLSWIWLITGGERQTWLPYVFLLIYGIFFAITGINQLQVVTITGKLIRVDYRGRVGMVATLIGSVIACLLAWFLLRMWLPSSSAVQSSVGDKGNFAAIFGFTGLMFLIAAGWALRFREDYDEPREDRRSGLDLFRSTWSTIRSDHNFRLLTIIAALFGMSLTLFPHYQSLARERLSLGLAALVPWVIAQNLGAAVFSVPAGWLADRVGNRIVIRIIMLTLSIPPVLAIVASYFPEIGMNGFIAVFFLIGLTPVTFRVLFNYTLEIIQPSEHPRYLSTLSLFMAGPAILTSAFFGALVDWISFEFVFGLVVACLILAWLLTFKLKEPRHQNI